MTPERAADSCLFVPVPHEIKYGEADRSGLELLAGAKDREDRSQMLQTDIETLERSIEQVLEMLERVSNYVSNVLEEEAEPSSALGQFLLNTLSLAPKVEPADIERDLYVAYDTLSSECVLEANIPLATTMSRMSCWCHTWPTRYAHRLISRIVSRRRRSRRVEKGRRMAQGRVNNEETRTKTDKDRAAGSKTGRLSCSRFAPPRRLERRRSKLSSSGSPFKESSVCLQLTYSEA